MEGLFNDARDSKRGLTLTVDPEARSVCLKLAALGVSVHDNDLRIPHLVRFTIPEKVISNLIECYKLVSPHHSLKSAQRRILETHFDLAFEESLNSGMQTKNTNKQFDVDIALTHGDVLVGGTKLESPNACRLATARGSIEVGKVRSTDVVLDAPRGAVVVSKVAEATVLALSGTESLPHHIPPPTHLPTHFSFNFFYFIFKSVDDKGERIWAKRLGAEVVNISARAPASALAARGCDPERSKGARPVSVVHVDALFSPDATIAAEVGGDSAQDQPRGDAWPESGASGADGTVGGVAGGAASSSSFAQGLAGGSRGSGAVVHVDSLHGCLRATAALPSARVPPPSPPSLASPPSLPSPAPRSLPPLPPLALSVQRVTGRVALECSGDGALECHFDVAEGHSSLLTEHGAVGLLVSHQVPHTEPAHTVSGTSAAPTNFYLPASLDEPPHLPFCCFFFLIASACEPPTYPPFLEMLP